MNFKNLRKTNINNDSKSGQQNFEFILHLKRNYFHDGFISEKKNLNNSIEKNQSRIINNSNNSKTEAYIENIPYLYSDFMKLDYITSEILNEIFDLYEEKVFQYSSFSRKNRKSQINDCFTLDIGKPQASNAKRK